MVIPIVKSYQTPRFLAEVPFGAWYVCDISALKVDAQMRTIWVDILKSPVSKLRRGIYNFPIGRMSIGKEHDFQFVPNHFSPRIFELLDLLKDKRDLSIPRRIDILISEIGSNPQLREKFQFTNDDQVKLIQFRNFVSRLPKEGLGKLLQDNSYALLYGVLDTSEELLNRQGDLTIVYEKPKITFEQVQKYFEGIILNPKIIDEVLVAMNVPQILRGEVPKSGGACLIDMGGTGKSMLKKAFSELFRAMGAEVKEKSQADITSYVNAGPQLIQSWYMGGTMEGLEGKKEPEVNLVAMARKNKIPSLLIIDEAEEFIRDRESSERSSLGNTTGILKRFIQDHEKGGVTGYVVTLLIANLTQSEIHKPLIMGGERLKPIYVGPPKEENLWIQLIDLYTKKLEFSSEFTVDSKKKFAQVLIDFNSKYSAQQEQFMVNPRRFADFCSTYYELHSQEERPQSFANIFHRLIHTKDSSWEIESTQFILDFINEVLAEKLKLSGNSKEEISVELKTFRERFVSESSQKSSSFTQEEKTKIKRFKGVVGGLLNWANNNSRSFEIISSFQTEVNTFIQFARDKNSRSTSMTDLYSSCTLHLVAIGTALQGLSSNSEIEKHIQTLKNTCPLLLRLLPDFS